MLVTIQEWFNGSRVNQEPGGGLFSPLHIVLIICFFTLIIINYFLSKKNHDYAARLIKFCCVFMPISRIIRMIMELAFELKTPLEILPFHLCHLMAFIIPLTYLVKFKKAYPCVMFYGMLGGTMTFLFGNYYAYKVLNFYDIESIILHTMLALVATSSFAKGDFKFLPNNIYIIPIFLLILCGWAMIGNYLTGANFMFLKENGLPFKLLPGHHFFTYLLIAFVIFFSMYLPYIIKHFKNKKTKKN